MLHCILNKNHAKEILGLECVGNFLETKALSDVLQSPTHILDMHLQELDVKSYNSGNFKHTLMACTTTPPCHVAGVRSCRGVRLQQRTVMADKRIGRLANPMDVHSSK